MARRVLFLFLTSLVAMNVLLAAPKYYARLGDAPEGADLYKVVGEEMYVDANTLHASIKTRITKNADAYTKVDRSTYTGGNSDAGKSSGDDAMGDHYDGYYGDDYQEEPVGFEKVDLEEIKKMETEAPSGVKMYEHPVAASEKVELIEFKKEEIEALPDEVLDQLFYGKAAKKMEEPEKKEKREEILSKMEGDSVYLEERSTKSVLLYKDFRELVSNRNKLKKVTSSDKRKIGKNIEEVVEEVERREKEGPQGGPMTMDKMIGLIERQLKSLEERLKKVKGASRSNLMKNMKFVEAKLERAQAISKMDLSDQDKMKKWREQMAKVNRSRWEKHKQERQARQR